jgi:lincosamide nucleotidyltransferase A/C/D/E
MTLTEVFEVLDALSAAGCQYWLEGGWGVDALVGHPTREHRDVDIDLDRVGEEAALVVLARLGYQIETDWRPNRVELSAPDRGWVDLHPLLVDPDGSARQPALGGGYHHFPNSYFVVGSLDGRPIPCVSAAAQCLFHSGYEPRQVDVHDLALLDVLETGG